ncbi:hypothetical protein [Candidatus Clostridium radicumherbarum]|uniref:Lipoprotein n=1 Tax=Candidatus Clostridium radicumherbarum TaxID=3381662 RepID=A0ABW8TUN0_9CLOT
MFKKGIAFILFFLVILTGCTAKPLTNNQNKSIPFKYLYAGFVLQTNTEQSNSDNGFPVGTIVFNTNKEWMDFINKYFIDKNSVNHDFKYADMSYRLPGDKVDFTKESIIYNSALSAKNDVYVEAYQIYKIEIEKNQPKVIMKDLDNNLSISTACLNGYQRYIILVSVYKSDLQK